MVYTGDFSGTHPLGWHAHADAHKSTSDDGNDAGRSSSQFHWSDLVDTAVRAIERNVTSASEKGTERVNHTTGLFACQAMVTGNHRGIEVEDLTAPMETQQTSRLSKQPGTYSFSRFGTPPSAPGSHVSMLLSFKDLFGRQYADNGGTDRHHMHGS